MNLRIAHGYICLQNVERNIVWLLIAQMADVLWNTVLTMIGRHIRMICLDFDIAPQTIQNKERIGNTSDIIFSGGRFRPHTMCLTRTNCEGSKYLSLRI
ncbi:hypothetical protein SAMN04488556_0079 [Halostagnicola kamekurae]|uniref:Uncharacterized protein n=1 Tax=Halostagnicola kamekurae TaxID=619731 RepID=A0A1I6V624_9EURY|nr:hypothetical protein SAMN04488556_0079 [Halostagnicola kamekurae]